MPPAPASTLPATRLRRREAAWATVFAAVAVLAAAAAWRFRHQLDDRRPPLSHVPPVAGAAGPRLARRAVLVIVDGLRLDTSRGLPALDALRRRGVDGVAVAEVPTVSRPGYATLLTGVPPSLSGVRTNFHEGRIPLDSLPATLSRHGLAAAAVSHPGGPLATLCGRHLPERAPPAAGAAWRDAALAEAARGADLAVILILDVDVAGHASGGASAAYRAAARAADTLVGDIAAAMDLSRDALVVTADHGHVDAGGHGGDEPEVTRVPLVLAGAGLRAGAVLSRERRLADVAPTLATLLGVPAPGHAAGRAPAEAFLAAPPGDADDVRLAALARGIADPGDVALRAALARRALRVVLSTAAVVLLLILGARERRRGGATPLMLRAGNVAALAGSTAMTLPFAGWPPSPSTSHFRDVVWFGPLATILAILVVAGARQGLPAPDRGTGSAIHAMTLLAAVMGAVWTFGFPPFPSALPPAALLPLPPIAMLGAAAFAAAQALLLVAAAAKGLVAGPDRLARPGQSDGPDGA